MKASVILVMAPLLLVSCGGQAGPSANQGHPAPSRVWDESEVLKRAHIESVDGGATYQLISEPDCTAAVVMTNAGAVETYRSAGDAVATNPDGTAGVKVTAGERATCLRLFTDALRAVK